MVDLQASPPTPRTILQASADTLFVVLDWARNNVNRIVFDVVPSTSTAGTLYTVDFSATTVSSPVLIGTGRHPSFSPDNASIVYVREASRMRRMIARLTLGTGTSIDLAVGTQPDWRR